MDGRDHYGGSPLAVGANRRSSQRVKQIQYIFSTLTSLTSKTQGQILSQQLDNFFDVKSSERLRPRQSDARRPSRGEGMFCLDTPISIRWRTSNGAIARALMRARAALVRRTDVCARCPVQAVIVGVPAGAARASARDVSYHNLPACGVSPSLPW